MGHIIWSMGFLLCLLLVASATPMGSWITEVVEKATDHDHWEHIVKRHAVMARFNSRYADDDDTAPIVNVQEYYRSVFDEGWGEYRDNEKELFNMLDRLESVLQNRDRSHEAVAQEDLSHVLEFGIHTKHIKGRFIVMLQDGADDYVLDRTMAVLQKANQDSGKKIRASDMHALRFIGKGFTATLNSLALSLISKHPMLGHIEEDTALRRSEVLTHEDEAKSEETVPWNLDRLDQRSRVLDNEYHPNGDGANVDIYVIDTGVLLTHEEFEGRAHYSGFDAIDFLTGTNDNGKDCNGHGTHCSGTAAGKTYGVAKKANIYNLRALNCEGTGAVSGIVIGIDKIIQGHKESNTGRPRVISQSLGVKKSQSLNKAIQRAVESGIPTVGAAGNQHSISCDYSPPSARVGIAVGATDRHDEVSIFTNTGECTDIMAPGSQIKSASQKCDTCTKTMSGTSMATPHAAGAAAIMLSQNPRLTATQVKEKMISDSTKGTVMMSSIASVRASDTPNRLLYVKSSNADMKESVKIQDIRSRP